MFVCANRDLNAPQLMPLGCAWALDCKRREIKKIEMRGYSPLLRMRTLPAGFIAPCRTSR